jgi:hypothetical protein
MFYIVNPTTLVDWLSRNHIDPSAWGRNGAKSIDHLWGEIQRGESILCEDPPRRTVQVAQIWLRRGDLLLFEKAQTLSDGSIRIIDSLPAEKMLPDESPTQAALRCLLEELQISPNEAMILSQKIECQEKQESSFSYPGLPSFYAIYRVHIAIDELPNGSFITSELSPNPHDPVVLHHWEWSPVTAYRSR